MSPYLENLAFKHIVDGPDKQAGVMVGSEECPSVVDARASVDTLLAKRGS